MNGMLILKVEALGIGEIYELIVLVKYNRLDWLMGWKKLLNLFLSPLSFSLEKERKRERERERINEEINFQGNKHKKGCFGFV